MSILREARLVILSMFEGDVEIQRALDAGARGYLLKSMPPEELVNEIRQVHAGKRRLPPEVASQLSEYLGEESLTPREIEVLQQVATGGRNREIGEILGISEVTVKVHVLGCPAHASPLTNRSFAAGARDTARPAREFSTPHDQSRGGPRA